ncbi:MAG: SUMF1/EgtB/PvdO family nonheme iron enzyme [Bradymonadaceae bacterium]
MGPEQVRGEHEIIGLHTDVFALGAGLFEILTGERAFEGESAPDSMMKVVETEPLDECSVEHVPQGLVRVCERALATHPDERYSHAGRMQEELEAWLQGRTQREKAERHVRRGRQLRRRLEDLRDRRDRLWTSARRQLEEVAYHDPVAEKLAGWGAEEQARELDADIARAETEFVDELHSALEVAPEVDDARRMLADHFRVKHERALERGDRRKAARWEEKIRRHDVQGDHRRYLEGRAELSLRTEPSGARVELSSWETVHRRRRPTFERHLGRTPLDSVELEEGSYLLEIERPDGSGRVRYPIQLERGEEWTLEPPEGSDAGDRLELPDSSHGDEVAVVPAGWVELGGRAPSSLRTVESWVESFAIMRRPVTHGEYLTFLNALVERGLDDRAEEHCPRFERAVTGSRERRAYERDEDGRFVIPEDREYRWGEDHPVFAVSWEDARAYASWYSQRTGRTWRLPTEFEWEKAARGTDGRRYPWGDYFDPNWCQMRFSDAAKPSPVPAGSVDGDESPFDVRGLAGNVSDWCRNPLEVDIGDGVAPPDEIDTDDERRVVRGGNWAAGAAECAAVHRVGFAPDVRRDTIGFRLARSASQ